MARRYSSPLRHTIKTINECDWPSGGFAMLRDNHLSEGFQIQDLKIGSTFPSLRTAIDSRDRHIEVYDLIQSMKDHAEVPSTFDGEIPEFAFGDGEARLLIGQRYMVTDPDGNESPWVINDCDG